MLMEGRRPDSVKFNLLIRFNTKERTTVSIIPPPYPSLIQAGPLFPHASSRALSFTRDTSALSGCDDWEARRLRRRGLESWGGGIAHRALLMGTQCAERQEAAHSSRQHCHHRGRDKVGGWERERERGLLFSHFVYRLSLASTQTREDQSAEHTHKLTQALTDTHTTHMHARRQRHT